MNFLLQLIVGLVISIGSTLLQQAFAPKQDQQTGRRGAVQIGGKVPQSFLVGTIGVAGKHDYRGTWGQSGEVPNAYLTDVFSLGDLPIDGINRVFAQGVDIGPGGGSSSAQGVPFAAYNIGGNRLWRIFRDGTATTALSFLVDTFGGAAERPWTSDMIGRGVPHMVMTALWDEEVWAGFPEYIFECRGIRLYDPRRDSTAGGSGSHRWGQPNTYEWTDNNAVIIYNIERGIWYDGRHVWGGKKTAVQMPYDVWAAAMDACDELVPLNGGGSEKRYRAGREIFLDERPAGVIQELLTGANARISHAADGTVYILVGIPSTADGAIGTGDVMASEPIRTTPFPNLDDIINGCAATYLEPSQAWGEKETAPYTRSDLVARDDNREQARGLDLGTTFSGTQAQRILKATIEESRRFLQIAVALRPAYAQYRPLQVLSWTDPARGFVNKLFLIIARTRGPFGEVVFGLQEIDPSDFNWTPGTDQKPLTFSPVTTNRPTPQPVQGFSVEPAIEGRRGGYDAFWSAASVRTDVQFVRIAHRTPGATADRWVGVVPLPELLSGHARVLDSMDRRGETVEVQIQYLSRSGRATLASNWLLINVPASLVDRDDLFDGVIGFDKLGDDVRAWQEWIGPSEIGKLQARARELFDMVTALALDIEGERVSERRSVESRSARGFAQAHEELLTLAGPEGVLAQQIEGVEVSLGEALARAEDTLTAAIVENEDGITSVSSRVTTTEAALNGYLGLNAVATTFTAQLSMIEANGDDISALALSLTELEAEIEGDIATAISLLQAEVDIVDGKATANAVALTALSAEVDGIEAGINIRAEAQASPGGGWSRYGVSLYNENISAFFFMDVNGSLSRVVFQFDQFVIMNSAGTVLALFASDGKIQGARIPTILANMIGAGQVTADKINVTSLDAISANLGSIIVGSANIGNAQITRLKIENGAVTDIVRTGPTTFLNPGVTLSHNAGTMTAGDLVMVGAVVDYDFLGSPSNLTLQWGQSGTWYTIAGLSPVPTTGIHTLSGNVIAPAAGSLFVRLLVQNGGGDAILTSNAVRK